MVADFTALFRVAPPAGVVGRAFLERRLLARGLVATRSPDGVLVELERAPLPRSLTVVARPLLEARGVTRLTRDALRGPDRRLTQALGAVLRAGGHPGVAYRSRLDGRPCAAICCDRATLRPHPGAPVEALEAVPELDDVLSELGLRRTH